MAVISLIPLGLNPEVVYSNLGNFPQRVMKHIKFMKNSIGNKLKSLRKQKGLSQEQVCEYLHISQSAYARIESGESNSWSIHLEKISAFYDIKPEELVKNKNVIICNIDTNNGVGNTEVLNQLSEKLINQLEVIIIEKDEIIAELRAKLNKLG